MSQSAPSPVGRECERRWVEPLVDRLGIGNISIPVWPILYVATREDAGDIVTLSPRFRIGPDCIMTMPDSCHPPNVDLRRRLELLRLELF